MRVTIAFELQGAMCPLSIDKQTKQRLKSIRKEIKQLKKRHDRMEFRPCNCDAELRAKDLELETLRRMISDLEKEQDRCILNSSLGHSTN